MKKSPDQNNHLRSSITFKSQNNKLLPWTTRNLVTSKHQISNQNKQFKKTQNCNLKNPSLSVNAFSNQILKSKSTIECLTSIQAPVISNQIVIDFQKEYEEDKELLDILNENINDDEWNDIVNKDKVQAQKKERINKEIKAISNQIKGEKKATTNQSQQQHQQQLQIQIQIQHPQQLPLLRISNKNERHFETPSSTECTCDNTKKTNCNGYNSNEDLISSHINYLNSTKSNGSNNSIIIPSAINSRPCSNLNTPNQWTIDKYIQTKQRTLARECWGNTNYTNKFVNNHLKNSETNTDTIKPVHRINCEKDMLSNKFMNSFKVMYPSDFDNHIGVSYCQNNSGNWIDHPGRKGPRNMQYLCLGKSNSNSKKGWIVNSKNGNENGPIKIISNWSSYVGGGGNY